MSPPAATSHSATTMKPVGKMDAESSLLKRLSPHGIAKLNRELLAGKPLSKVMADLRTVYDICRARRQMLREKLSDEAQTQLKRLGRPYTHQELMLFGTAPMDWIHSAMDQLITKEGYPFDLAIEELAEQFEHMQLESDARDIQQYYGPKKPVQVAQLATTLCPASLTSTSRNIVRMTAKKVLVSLSPIMLWFNMDDDLDDVNIDQGLSECMESLASEIEMAAAAKVAIGAGGGGLKNLLQDGKSANRKLSGTEALLLQWQHHPSKPLKKSGIARPTLRTVKIVDP